MSIVVSVTIINHDRDGQTDRQTDQWKVRRGSELGSTSASTRDSSDGRTSDRRGARTVDDRQDTCCHSTSFLRPTHKCIIPRQLTRLSVVVSC